MEEREDIAPASLPRSGRLFAVGDIHGCADELARLLAALDLAAGDKVVFVGDYVDRGPDSRGVIDRLIELRDSTEVDTVFLKGNHEDMMLGYLGERGSHGEVFLMNGGRATLASYGLAPTAPLAEVREALPEAHLEFLRRLELFHRDPPYLFVHAGIAPLRTLEQQDEEDLLWIREEFLRNRHKLQDTVVFGHTPQREVLWHMPYKIGLDTGCVYGNKLSCLDFTSATLFQLDRKSRRVTRRNVERQLHPPEPLKPEDEGV
jgi:serine/threonine protein phosphatase 1